VRAVSPLSKRETLLAVLVAATALVAGCIGTERTDDNPNDGAGPGDGTTGPGPGNQSGPLVGGNATTPAGNASVGAGNAVQVTIVDNAFQPDAISVPSGGAATFTNNGQAIHSVTIQKDGGLLEHFDQDVNPGQSVTVTFADDGVYKLRCKYHSTDYDSGPHIGRITVG
jgi:plastocyanin